MADGGGGGVGGNGGILGGSVAISGGGRRGGGGVADGWRGAARELRGFLLWMAVIVAHMVQVPLLWFVFWQVRHRFEA